MREGTCIPVFIAVLVFTAVFATWLNARQNDEETETTYQWRQCAPAQNGLELVSSVQFEDRTECFYQKQNRIQQHTVPRKETI